MLEPQWSVSCYERRHFCLILEIQGLTGGKHRGYESETQTYGGLVQRCRDYESEEGE